MSLANRTIDLASKQVLVAADGTAAAPSITNDGDTNTGMFFPAADTIGFSGGGNELMRIDSSGRVGIGTTTPGVKLHISSGSADAQMRIESTGGASYDQSIHFKDTASDWYIGNKYSGATNSFGVGRTQAKDDLVIDSSGNVGIGTASPSTKLNVSAGRTTLSANNENFALQLNYGSTANGCFLGSSGADTFLISSSGGAERLRIDSSGNVGIGETNPQRTLHVKSSSASEILRLQSVSNTGQAWIGIYKANGTRKANVGFGSSVNEEFFISNEENGPMSFYTNNTERLRITSGGELCVGATGPSNAAKAHFNSSSIASSSRGIVTIESGKSGDVGDCVLSVVKYDNNSTTSQVFLRFGINQYNTNSGQINANGASQVAFGTFSDSRLKQNITDLPSQWQNIKILRPVEFDYIESEGGGHQIGFIAQEVREIYPDAVGERSDGMLTISGMGKNEARLIKALQEAMDRIEQLEENNTALESRIAALEAA